MGDGASVREASRPSMNKCWQALNAEAKLTAAADELGLNLRLAQAEMLLENLTQRCRPPLGLKRVGSSID